MGKASNQKKKRRQGTGASRADPERQRAWEQLALAAQKLNSMFQARKEHLAAVSRSWWRGAEPEAAEVPDWTEGSAGDRFFENSRMKTYAVAPRLATAEIPSAGAFAADSGHWNIAALAELNCTLKPSGKVLAQTLRRAAADFYRLGEESADAETMRQLGGKSYGNPLDCLISEKVIEPADALTIGLAVLATLADLCRTAGASVRVPC